MKWSLPLGMVFIVWFGFAAAAVGLRALAQSTAPFPDLFSVYADVFPGQSRSAADAHGFICHSIPYPAPAETTCRINLATGTFSSAGVLISEGMIYEVNFTFRKHGFRLGDLMLALGIPEIHHDNFTTYYFWPSKGLKATTIPNFAGRLSLFAPVRSVSFWGL